MKQLRTDICAAQCRAVSVRCRSQHVEVMQSAVSARAHDSPRPHTASVEQCFSCSCQHSSICTLRLQHAIGTRSVWGHARAKTRFIYTYKHVLSSGAHKPGKPDVCAKGAGDCAHQMWVFLLIDNTDVVELDIEVLVD